MADFTTQRKPSENYHRISLRSACKLIMRKTSIYDIPSDGEIILTLEGACIQSTAEQALRKLVDSLLSDRVAGLKHESAVELLSRFLETSNFRQLRANYPELRADSKHRVRLFYASNGTVVWDFLEGR